MKSSAYLYAVYCFLLCFFVWLCDFVLFFGVVIALVLGKLSFNNCTNHSSELKIYVALLNWFFEFLENSLGLNSVVVTAGVRSAAATAATIATTPLTFDVVFLPASVSASVWVTVDLKLPALRFDCCNWCRGAQLQQLQQPQLSA
jgi:hypothetical protein